MKRTLTFRPWHAGIASVHVTICLVGLAGSSGCGSGGSSSAGAGPLDESEIAAIKQQSKNGRDFLNSVKRKTLEKAGMGGPIDDVRNTDKKAPPKRR